MSPPIPPPPPPQAYYELYMDVFDKLVISGLGSLAPGATGSASWTLVPGRGEVAGAQPGIIVAGPDDPVEVDLNEHQRPT